MEVGKSFVQRLFIAFLTGFGIAAGVSLFVLPRTSRQTVSMQSAGILKLFHAALLAHGKFLKSIVERQEADAGTATDRITRDFEKEDSKKQTHLESHKSKILEGTPRPAPSLEAEALKSVTTRLGDLFGKMQLELRSACDEVAYGNLGPDDLKELNLHMREILVPFIGLATVVDLIPSSEYDCSRDNDRADSDNPIDIDKALNKGVPDDVAVICLKLFQLSNGPMLKALMHISLRLDVAKLPKGTKADVESTAGIPPQPGAPAFATYLEQKMSAFDRQRDTIVREWLDSRGLAVHNSSAENQRALKNLDFHRESISSEKHLVLYMGVFYKSVGKAILKAVKWADSKHADGTMTKKQLVSPTWNRFTKSLVPGFSNQQRMSNIEVDTPEIRTGDSLSVSRKDPEHLPPTNFYQRSTNHVRIVARFFGSPESAFGFRCAVATMSIGILAYLEQTREFFLVQRLQWSLFMIAVSMSIDAGHNVFEFAMRIAGTVVAICFSMIIWYVCDQKTAAIIPVLFIYLFCRFYFVIKFPLYLRAAIISIMSSVLLTGYELQVRQLGIARATVNGQPYYPMYELAPYRLATVAGGLTVAFFWVFFPYPSTTRGLLRQGLGSTLYSLASLHSCVQSTVEIRLHSGSKSGNDEQRQVSPAFKLFKARQKLFSDITLLLQRLREQSKFSKFEPTIGGKFPKQTYDNLIRNVQNIFNYTMLTGYCTNIFRDKAAESDWLQDIRLMSKQTSVTSHDMTSLLCILAASVTNGQPVPPYLRSPRPHNLRTRMEAIDTEKLSLEHLSEPCFAAFSVLEICSSMISEETAKAVKNVQDLVGEVDFSFQDFEQLDKQ